MRDILYGDVSFTGDEMCIISSPSFSRLRKIKQLAFGEYIFPNATHNRYTHSLGVATVITKMYDAIQRNCGGYLNEDDKKILRMMGLVHDIGHSPYSHSSISLSEITHEDRLPEILNIERNNLHLGIQDNSDPIDIVSQIYLGEGRLYYLNEKYMLLHEFMDNFIDADKLDYLRRDSYMCGVSYGNFEINDLIDSLTLIPAKNGLYHLGILPKGIHALENFILARYYMYSNVYLDPISCLYDKLYLKEVVNYLPNGTFPTDTKKFLTWDDSRLVGHLSFLDNTGFELVYDKDFSEKDMHLIDSRLGNCLLKDIIKKSVYRKDSSDKILYVKDDILNRVVPATDVSPVLKSMEFARLHRLRYYAPSDIAKDVRKRLRSLLGGISKYEKKC